LEYIEIVVIVFSQSKLTEKYKEKKVGVARLKPTRDDNSKGNRIGLSLFYTSELHPKYIKIIGELTS